MSNLGDLNVEPLASEVAQDALGLESVVPESQMRIELEKRCVL